MNEFAVNRHWMARIPETFAGYLAVSEPDGLGAIMVHLSGSTDNRSLITLPAR